MNDPGSLVRLVPSGRTTTSGAAAGRELGRRRPGGVERAAALTVVLPPAAPSRLATLAAAGLSLRLAGEQVVRGRRRPQLTRRGSMKILVAGWDSGGGVEAVQTVVRRAVARGHDVRVLGTEGLRSRFESAGASFRPYKYAPDNDLRQAETDLLKDWQVRNPLSLWARVRDRLLVGPAREFCRDVLEELHREAADVVAVDTLIPTAAFGAEAAGVPAVIVMHGPYMVPRADAPPLGTGFMPATGSLGRLRDKSAAALALALFRRGLPALNQARAEFGLAPLRDALDVMGRAGRVLVCSSPSYDFAPGSVPVNVRYVGPQLDDAASAAAGDPWAGPTARPLVLVGLEQHRHAAGGPVAAGRRRPRAASGAGTCHHRPGRGPGGDRGSAKCDRHPVGAPRRCPAALLGRHHPRRPWHRDEGFDCRGTAGRRATGPRPARQRCPGGPRRRGPRLRKNASVSVLSAAVAHVIDDPRYHAAAGQMASRLAAERDDNLAVDELEHAAAGARAATSGRSPASPCRHVQD